MCGPITEWQIVIIKENISHYCEAMIDHSQLSYLEKDEQKRQMKQSLEVYIQGVKDEMRGMGRMKIQRERSIGHGYFSEEPDCKPKGVYTIEKLCR